MPGSALRRNLNSGLRLASHAVKNGSTLPILGAVRQTPAAGFGWRQIAATDLELAIVVQVGALVAGALDAAAPAARRVASSRAGHPVWLRMRRWSARGPSQ